MSGLQKKVTNFFRTGSRKSKESGSRQSAKNRSNATRRVATSRPKKFSGSAARRPPNAHSKSRSKKKTGSDAITSKSRQGSSRFGKVKVVKVHRPSSQSKSSKKGPHSRSNNQKRDVSNSVLPKPRGSGSKSHSEQRNSCIKKFTSSGRCQKPVMWCPKLGVFVAMLGQLCLIIYIFVIDILRDEIPTSTGLVLSLTHLMIIFLSVEVIFYATKTLCLFTCLADLLAILASFIYIAIRESSNNYLGKNVAVTQSAKVLHEAVFVTAESCVLLMLNLCMVLGLYTEIRSTSSTEIKVAVINMDLESADQERERHTDLEKASLTQKIVAFVPGKSSASTAPPPPQPTPGKEIPATVLATVLPESEKSTTSQKPSPPKLTLPATSSEQTPEKPRISAQNVPTAVTLEMAVPPKTAVSAMTTSGGPLECVQTAKLNETPEVVTAIPQQATNTPEKPISWTTTANVTGTPIAQNMATFAADPSRLAADSAHPPSSASGATPMRYLYEAKQKANQ